MLAGQLAADEGSAQVQKLNISYKPQKIAPKFEGTVRDILQEKIRDAFIHPQFKTDVLVPLMIEDIIDQRVREAASLNNRCTKHSEQVLHLSGGELQRLAICLVLGRPADIYLIDEPSAYLDSEQRIVAAKVIKRYILHSKKTAFIVEHDFIMATYLADRVVVYEGTRPFHISRAHEILTRSRITGEPAVDCVANRPESLLTGMNKFLKSLDITFRRDPSNFRPRINKADSVKDVEQKAAGNYFFMENDD